MRRTEGIVPRHIPPLDRIRTVHLMAICGTGMGAFAGLLREAGLTVTGSDDQVYPPMSDQLAAMGIQVMRGYKAENLSHRPDLTIVGNAIRRTNPEAEALLASDLAYTSFPEALGQLVLAKRHSVVVAGTHGKTTVSSMIAWTLHRAGREPGFLIGGVLRNFGANQALGREGGPFVVEGDEYDTAFFEKTPKFIHYRPRTAILTSVEFDHADIYADFEAVDAAFRRLAGLIPDDGLMVACTDHPSVRDVIEDCEGWIQTYGESKDREWRGEISRPDAEGMTIRIHRRGEAFLETRVRLVGRHNLLNFTGAAAVLAELGLTPQEISEGFASFEGVRRRQEVIAEVLGVTIIDDFAHHPTAVKETIAATRLRYPGRRLWAVFEPRTATSRRRVFQEEYAGAFEGADRVLVAAVHHGADLPAEDRFDPPALVEAINARGGNARSLPDVDAIIKAVEADVRAEDVVLIMSNGGFGGIYKKLPAALAEE